MELLWVDELCLGGGLLTIMVSCHILSVEQILLAPHHVLYFFFPVFVHFNVLG